MGRVGGFLMNKDNLITIFFVVIWLIAWLSNALHHTMFDLGQLMQLYLSVIVPRLGFHVVNSVYNSPKGAPPQ